MFHHPLVPPLFRACLPPLVCITALASVGPVGAVDFSGRAGVQSRSFFNPAADPGQHQQTFSAVIEPEWYHQWHGGDQFAEVKLFYRADQHDARRRHADIRELSLTSVFETWEFQFGISKVYWGVTETRHLVDIVNQTDFAENIDGEDKLGQPMLRASTEQDWGSLDFFILPGFRERRFPGQAGRPRGGVVVDTGIDAVYDASAGKHHVDFALRYAHYIDEWEFGLSLFDGTGREPASFRPAPVSTSGVPVVTPVYSLITQLGVDAQAFFGDWTWKLEAINQHVRSGNRQGTDSFQSTAGFEYTWVGIADSVMDLGFVVEYSYSDQRITETIFDNDLATALRFALNDAESTEILAGLITDLDNLTVAGFIEASRRIGDSLTLEAEIRTFHNTRQGRPLYPLRFDDFIQIDLNYHF